MASGSVHTELADCPLVWCRNLLSINHEEYLVVDAGFDLGWAGQKSTIHRYSVETNQWTHVRTVDLTHHRYSAVCYDPDTNSLVLIDSNDKLKTMDVERGDITFRCSFDFDAEAVVVSGGELHIFGTQLGAHGTRSQVHSVISKSSWKEITKLPFTNTQCVKPIVSKSRNSIIAAEFSANQRGEAGKMVLKEYSLRSKEWVSLEWSRSVQYYEFTAIVCTSDGRYVIRFGGGQSDKIVIFDFEEQKVRESAIKCPVEGDYKAVLMGSKKRDELTVFGFVNRAFKEPAFRDIQVLPLYFIKMAAQWYSNEQVHLLTQDSGRKNHWKVNVYDIIQS